ncbi:flagellar basal-body rod protein [Anaerotignum lactatifermentans]|uniref:flagellar basal-body rod protein n=1 Tax=Anaerotignum lactatifermentans TaxID=160404 RepID=UPI00266D3C6A|nr:flagellar basal-body rod protein [Anaerotignum lactatifermentans]
MYVHYAQIDENGYIVGISHLSGKMSEPNLIQIDEDFDPNNKRWNGESWESYTPPEPSEPEPTQLDRMEAQLNKSQDEIRQEGANSVMEELVKRGLMV